MSLTFNSFVSEIATLTAISSGTLVTGDNNFSGIMSGIIDYAEGRIWRDFDLPVVRVTDTSVTVSSGVKTVSLSTTQGTLLVIEALNLFSSAGTTSSNGSRIPVTPTTKAVVDAVYPSALSSLCGLPTYYARITDTQILFGPCPDQAYVMEVQATTRPAALSSGNSTTWISQNIPELMVAAGMVFAAGYMRDFGSQSDNPQLATSWEQQYQTLKGTMSADALRMKFQSQGWSVQVPNPIATPPRS